MIQKALIVESSDLFKSIILNIMKNAGIKCYFFSSGKEALEASHDEYTFIVVSRTLKDISGEVFLSLYGLKNGFGGALTILLTASAVDEISLDANKAGFKLVFNKKNLESFQELIIRILNKRILNLDANILFIEDSQSIADLIVSLFKKNKAEIHHVNNIKDMKEIFNELAFDLVITDYYLKNNETGDDVISYIRSFKNFSKSSTPILVVSSETNKKKRTSFLRNGANDFIIKPYDKNELLVRSSNLISTYRSLQQLRRQEKDLIKLALTDHLTGLYNRHSLYDVGPKYISNSQRHNIALSLLVIDLDLFKNVNDTYGHSVGDLVLKSISGVLSDCCRTEDIAARYGGEEFIMLLSNCDLDNAIQKAENLRYEIELCRPEELLITASIGVAELRIDDNFEMLFNRADKAVYAAKDTGRNKVVAVTFDNKIRHVSTQVEDSKTA